VLCAECLASGSYEECRSCENCIHRCTCEGDFDADELGLDPEEEWDYD
jgi:hypothetical protein